MAEFCLAAYVVFVVVALSFMVLALRRNDLVYKYRMQRLKEVAGYLESIDYGVWRSTPDVPPGDTYVSWAFENDTLGRISYDDMMWSLTKWRYRDFFPKSVEETLADAEKVVSHE